MHEIPFKNEFDPNIWLNVPKMHGNKEAIKTTTMNSVENELFFSSSIKDTHNLDRI